MLPRGPGIIFFQLALIAYKIGEINILFPTEVFLRKDDYLRCLCFFSPITIHMQCALLWLRNTKILFT